MKRKRLKRFISIINNFNCMVVFCVATMSLISPCFFACHKANSIGVESIVEQSETISKCEIAFGLKPDTKSLISMKKGVVDSEKEGGILNRIRQSDWTLVSVKNNDEYAVKEDIEENQKRFGCFTCHDDTREKWPEWSNFLNIF